MRIEELLPVNESLTILSIVLISRLVSRIQATRTFRKSYDGDFMVDMRLFKDAIKRYKKNRNQSDRRDINKFLDKLEGIKTNIAAHGDKKAMKNFNQIESIIMKIKKDVTV